MKKKNQYNAEGYKEGYWEERWNGQLYAKGNYINSIRVGYWEYYYSNGKLMNKGSFRNHIKVGYWEYYDSNGELQYKEYYLV